MMISQKCVPEEVTEPKAPPAEDPKNGEEDTAPVPDKSTTEKPNTEEEDNEKE